MRLAAATMRLSPTAIAVYATGAAGALALKAFSSGAGAGELRWVLGPTCWLAARLGGMSFIDEGAAGFISHADRLVVGAPCSGVNFLVVCFAALFFSYARWWRRSATKMGWLLASLLLAYAATVITNSVRVVVAARLFQADIYGGVLTPGRAHRLMGALLYCGSLVMVHELVGRVVRRLGDGARASSAIPSAPRFWLPSWLLASPLLWYLAVAVGVPLFQLRADSLDARFAEHLLTVFGVAGTLSAVVVVARTLADRLQSKAPGGASSP